MTQRRPTARRRRRGRRNARRGQRDRGSRSPAARRGHDRARPEIEAQLDGARGARALRRALLDEPTLTRSEAERLLKDLVSRARLPRPETNVRVAGHEVDCVWRSQRLVVEVDGYAYHGSRAAFERDRARDADLTAAGYRVVRFTWRQLTREPLAVVALLAVLLAR